MESKAKHSDIDLLLAGTSLLLVRNSLLFFIIMVKCLGHPIPNALSTSSYLEDVNRECLTNVETALVTEHALVKFVEYLTNEEFTEGITQIRAFTLIKEFEEYANALDTDDNNSVREKALDLWQKLTSKDSNIYMDGLGKEIKYMIQSKLQNYDEIIDQHLFDQVYGVIINSLQRLFIQFKISNECRRLSQDLYRRNVVTNRLKMAELI